MARNRVPGAMFACCAFPRFLGFTDYALPRVAGQVRSATPAGGRFLWNVAGGCAHCFGRTVLGAVAVWSHGDSL